MSVYVFLMSVVRANNMFHSHEAYYLIYFLMNDKVNYVNNTLRFPCVKYISLNAMRNNVAVVFGVKYQRNKFMY